MVKNRKLLIKRIVFIVITSITVLFIFAQSCLPAKVSGEESGRVLRLLNSITEFFGFGSVFSSHFVRKLAHFTEFAILGVFFALTVNTYKLKLLIKYVFSLMGCLFIAIFDECIQLFVPGRAGMISDVILDSCGSFTGITIIIAIIFLIKLIHTKTRGKYEGFENE